MERKTRGRRSEPRCPDAGCRPRARAARPGTGAIRGAQSLPEGQPPSCPACEPPPAPPVSLQPHSENEQGRGQPWAGLAEPGSRGASVCWDVTPGGSSACLGPGWGDVPPPATSPRGHGFPAAEGPGTAGLPGRPQDVPAPTGVSREHAATPREPRLQGLGWEPCRPATRPRQPPWAPLRAGRAR